MTEIIQYIEDNLSEDLNVEAVAKRSGYSVYHFQRMFAAITGLSMGGYIRRRRLTKAAFCLVETENRIIEIALDAGFESQEAFSRAFKSMFALNPGEFREHKLKPRMRSQNYMDENFIQHLQSGGITMEPKIIEHHEYHFIGLGGIFQPNETVKIGEELWPEFFNRIQEIPNKQGSNGDRYRTFGVCQEIYDKGILQDSFKYYAAVEVKADSIAPMGMDCISIPKQKYAVFTHTKGLASLGKTTKYIWGTWLPQSGYKLAPVADIEVYPSDIDFDSPNATFEIWIPLENLPL